MMLEASTGSFTTSDSSAPSDTPNEDQPRVPTRTGASGSAARITGMTRSAYSLTRDQLTPLGSLAIS